MIAMSVLYVEYIRDLFSSNLSLRPNIIEELEKTMMDIPYDEIIIDFSGVKSMSIEFTKEYLTSKHRSNKVRNEVNLPLDLQPIMDEALRSLKIHAS